MTKWELARYIIDAKKCIDGLSFISMHIKELSNINIYERCENLRQKFYITICVVLEEASPKGKKDLCKKDSIVRQIFYERDKNSAHKDKNYSPRKYDTLLDEINDKKKELNHIRNICKEYLPDNITLDFVPHDKELFRLIHRLNLNIENDANKIKYPLGVFHSYQLSEEGKHIFKEFDTEKQDRENARIFGYDYDKLITKNVLSSIDDIKELSDYEKERYAVIIENGINSYEGIQNRQDSCIKNNILFNQNIWVTPNERYFEMIKELQKIGLYDQFEIVHMDVFNDEEKRKKIEEIMERYK